MKYISSNPFTLLKLSNCKLVLQKMLKNDLKKLKHLTRCTGSKTFDDHVAVHIWHYLYFYGSFRYIQGQVFLWNTSDHRRIFQTLSRNFTYTNLNFWGKIRESKHRFGFPDNQRLFFLTETNSKHQKNTKLTFGERKSVNTS